MKIILKNGSIILINDKKPKERLRGNTMVRKKSTKYKPKYFIDTDITDMQNHQVGIHCFQANRFLNVSVNHMQTRESVVTATILAEELEYFLNHMHLGVTYGENTN